MFSKSTILSVFLMFSVVGTANALPTSDDFNSEMNASSHSMLNERIYAQTDGEVETIILQLGLTDEQIAQLYQVDRQFSPKLDELYPAWNQAQEELEVLIRSEDASESEVRKKYEEVESLRRQVSELQFERRMAIREILRPEQRLPYEEYIEQRIAESDS